MAQIIDETRGVSTASVEESTASAEAATEHDEQTPKGESSPRPSEGDVQRAVIDVPAEAEDAPANREDVEDAALEPESQDADGACATGVPETGADDFASASSDQEDQDAHGAEEGVSPLAEHPELDACEPAAQDASEEEHPHECTEPAKRDVDVAENMDDALASETTDETAGGDAHVDTDATNSDADTVVAVPVPDASCQSPEERSDGQIEGRILHVQATLPQDLYFVVPTGCKPGQILTVQGPHGPLHVQAPAGVKAGQKCAVRLAPPVQHEVFVPAGAQPGQKVTFLGENDEQLEAIVPPGKRPGQVFHVSPPVVMVPVPTGAVKGDRLAFTTPNGKALMADVPENLSPGQYFSVQY